MTRRALVTGGHGFVAQWAIRAMLERGWSVTAAGLGDPSKARERLGWEPTVRFHALVQMMIEADLARHSGTT